VILFNGFAIVMKLCG